MTFDEFWLSDDGSVRVHLTVFIDQSDSDTVDDADQSL